MLDEIDGVEFHLFGGHREGSLRGRPGELIATRDDAICRGTVDGAVWITHLKRRDSGLIDDAFGASLGASHDRTRLIAERLAGDPAALQCRLDRKRRRRAADEQVKPLEAYRREELARSHACFFGPDPSYHEARRRFVYKAGAGPVRACAAAARAAA